MYIDEITVWSDDRMEIEELSIFNPNVNALSEGWLPCQYPERPLNRNAAIKHIRKGEPCKPCGIAREAALKQNQPYTYWEYHVEG